MKHFDRMVGLIPFCCLNSGYLKIMGNPDWPERKPDMPTKVLIFEMLSGQAPWDSMGYDDNPMGQLLALRESTSHSRPPCHCIQQRQTQNTEHRLYSSRLISTLVWLPPRLQSGFAGWLSAGA